MSATKATILAVDDDPSIMMMLEAALKGAGYTARKAGSADEAFGLLKGEVVDLILLDVELPGISGLSLIDLLKKDPKTAAIPVILITVRRRESEKVGGLQAGADDYIVKPFSVKEMLARVEAVLRRTRRAGAVDRYFEIAGLRVDLDSREVVVKGKTIEMTALEFALLVRLLERRGQVLAYKVLGESLSDGFRVMTSGNLHNHVMNLRKKLGSAGGKIKTVRGLGFKFDAGR
ncbi:MAG: response regulator [Elusimicrobia bacterium]|nr:response regulator [Elusimicrobiota bacterium]